MPESLRERRERECGCEVWVMPGILLLCLDRVVTEINA